MAISIGDAILFLSADDKGLKKGLVNSEKITKASASRMSTHANAAAASVGKGMASMASKMALGLTGILGVSALKNYGNQWIQLGDQLEEQSQRTGLGVEMLSRLNFVAGKAGLSLENLEVTTRQMAKAIYNTATGTELFGSALGEIRAMKPEQQFMHILGMLDKIQNPTIRAALAMKIFGRSGTLVLPLVADGMQALNEEMAKADKSGVVFTAEEAKNAASFADGLQEIDNKLINLGGTIMNSRGMKLFMKLIDQLTALSQVRSISDFFDTTSEATGIDSASRDANGNVGPSYAGRQAASEQAFQDAKARNAAARAGGYNAAGDPRQRELMRQAMIFGNGGSGIDPAAAEALGPMYGPAPPLSRRAQGYQDPAKPPRPGVNAANELGLGTTINNITISNATFTAGVDMVKALNRKMAMSPGI
jgi:hypothetical protein